MWWNDVSVGAIGQTLCSLVGNNNTTTRNCTCLSTSHAKSGDYQQNANADNVHLFHGREIRKVPHAAGGMGFVLQLSLANSNDPEGWTQAEVDGYDGWGHDVGRTWRTGERLEQEGFADFRTRFGPESFALHHRFYLHKDGNNRMWLAAEDGCEGTPSTGQPSNPMSSLFGMFG